MKEDETAVRCFVCGTDEDIKYFIDGNARLGYSMQMDLCRHHGAELYTAVTEEGKNLLESLGLELGERE